MSQATTDNMQKNSYVILIVAVDDAVKFVLNAIDAVVSCC
jgi:hypothetical protein